MVNELFFGLALILVGIAVGCAEYRISRLKRKSEWQTARIKELSGKLNDRTNMLLGRDQATLVMLDSLADGVRRLRDERNRP